MGLIMTEQFFVTEDGIRRLATPLEIEGILSVRAENEDLILFQEAKLAAKESAKAKLAALGLTEDEVNAIIGGI